MAYRDYSVVKGLIVDASGHGDFTTISSAITAASSGQTIFIRPGTYTENPTIKAGVNLTAFDCDASPNGTGDVIINGTCSFSAAGTATISGVQLQTNAANLISVSGSSASVLNVINCYLNCSNFTGISLTSSSGSSSIIISGCNGDTGTTGISIYSSSSPGSISFQYSAFSNSGGSTTASTSSAGTVSFASCGISVPITVTSGGTLNASFTSIAGNTTSITSSGTSAVFLNYCNLQSNTASTISIGAGTSCRAEYCVIGSSNTNAITGAGSLQYAMLTFSASNGINVTTQTPVPLTIQQGGTGDSSFTSYAVLCGGTSPTGSLQTVSGVGTAGQVLKSAGAGALPTWQTFAADVVGPVSSTSGAVATWNGTGGTTLASPPSPLVSAGGVMTNANQPAFQAYMTGATTGNVTGDGTTITIPFNATLFDQGSHFDTANNWYVIPTTGVYCFSGLLYVLQGIAGTNTQLILFLWNGGVQYSPIVEPASGFNTTGQQAFTWSYTGQFTSGNHVYLQFLATGNAIKNVELVGTTGVTTLAGYLVG